MPKKLTEETSFADYEKAKKNEIKKAVKKGPVEHMHTERLDNGFMTTSRHEMPMNEKGNMMSMMNERESKHFHMTPEEMGSHHSMMMGGKQLIPGTPEQAAEAKADGAGDEDKD